MITKLKSILRLDSNFDRLVNEIRKNNFENWKETYEKFKTKYQKAITHNRSSKLGLEIYDTFFRKVVYQLKISSADKQSLTEVQDFFGISESEVKEIKAKYSFDVIQKLALKKFDDKMPTAEERFEIKVFTSELNMSEFEVERVIKKIAQNIYKKAVQKAMTSGEVSIETQEALEQLAQKLQLNLTDLGLDKTTEQRYNYLVLLNSLNNGYMPSKSTSAIVLQKKEVAHWEALATLLIYKEVTTGYSGASRGVSIKLLKGVWYRVGQSRSVPIKKRVSIKYSGIFVVTNKRVVFTSPSKSFSIPFTQLISFEHYSEGIVLQKENNSFLLSFSNIESAEISFKILANAINASTK